MAQLVSLLLDSPNHRTRTQAAYSLGNFTSPEAREALLNALIDPHEAVRVAALSSLAKVGDRSTVAELRGCREENRVVRDQLRRTLVLLEERFPETRQPVDVRTVKTVVEIEGIMDRTGGPESRVLLLRRFMSRHLRMQEGMALAEPPVGIGGIVKDIERRNVKAVVVTASLSSLAESRIGSDVVWRAELSIAVLDYPGRAIRAMIRNHAEVRRPASVYRPDQSESMQSKAIESATAAAVDDLILRLGEI